MNKERVYPKLKKQHIEILKNMLDSLHHDLYNNCFEYLTPEHKLTDAQFQYIKDRIMHVFDYYVAFDGWHLYNLVNKQWYDIVTNDDFSEIAYILTYIPVHRKWWFKCVEEPLKTITISFTKDTAFIK